MRALLVLLLPGLVYGAVSSDEVISASRVDSQIQKIRNTSQLQSSAENGDADSQYKLGLLTFYEAQPLRGTEQFADTISKAKSLIRQAAEQNHTKAMYAAAFFSDDSQERIRWLKKSAQANYPPALHEVGLMYFSGFHHAEDHEQDYAEALRYFERAAEQHSLRSQMRLALMYFNGYGVAKDTQKAHDLTLAAAEQNLARAYHRLALDWYDRGGLTPDRKKFRLYNKMYEHIKKKYSVFCGEDSRNQDGGCSEDIDYANEIYQVFYQMEAFI